MSTDASNNGDVVNLYVKEPKRLLDELNELAEELNDINQSEFLREVLRDITEPNLTPGENAPWPDDHRDVVALVLDETEDRIGTLWNE